MSNIREAQVEDYLVDRIKALKGMCVKFVSPGLRGVPDRIVLLPDGRIYFIELKRPGKKATPQQLKRHRELKDLGHTVHVIDTFVGVDIFCDWVVGR